jgi:hypothetical protein
VVGSTSGSILSSLKPVGLVSLRGFHGSSHQQALKPFLLADIGEGITECEVIQWYTFLLYRVAFVTSTHPSFVV